MKNFKRILVVSLAIVLACGLLTACNDTPDAPASKLATPEIRVEKGSATNIVWDAVENAVSYIVTINGKEYPATATSFPLADDKEYTVTVRAVAKEAAYNSDPSNMLRLSYGFNEDAVVLRFAAFSDVHVSSDKIAGKLRDVMRKTLEKYEIDAFMFPGDLTNAQNTSKNTVLPQMALFAAGVAEGNQTAKLPLIYCLGNHDYPTFSSGAAESVTSSITDASYLFPAGTTNYDATMELFEDADLAFFSEDAWPVPALTVPDGFRYNAVNGFSFFGVDYTHVNADTLTFLKAQLDAVAEEAPDKQIFITSHMPHQSGSQPDGLTALLEQYPQAVYISGHSHDTLQTYSAVVAADGFLELNLGPGDHAAYGIDGPGRDYNLYQMKQGAIIEVDENGHMRFLGIDYSMNETDYGFTHTLNEEYVVAETPMVIRTAYFGAPSAAAQSPVLYDSVVNSESDERYHEPYYAEAPVMNFTSLNKDYGKAGIPAADAANVIIYYTVSLKNETTGALVSIYDKQAKTYVTALKTPANHIYYPSGDYMPSTLWFDLKFEHPQDLTHTYTLYLQGVDDFGKATPEYAFSLSLANATYRSTGVKTN